MKYLISFVGRLDPFTAKKEEGPLIATIRFMSSKFAGEHFKVIVMLTDEFNNKKDRDYLEYALNCLKQGDVKCEQARNDSNISSLFKEGPIDFSYDFYPKECSCDTNDMTFPDAVSNEIWVPRIRSVLNECGIEDADNKFYINTTSGTSQISSAIRFILNISDKRQVKGVYASPAISPASSEKTEIAEPDDYRVVKTNDMVEEEEFSTFRNFAASDTISMFLNNYLFEDALEIAESRTPFSDDARFIEHLKAVKSFMDFNAKEVMVLANKAKKDDSLWDLLFGSGVLSSESSCLYFAYLLFLERLVIHGREHDFYNSISQFYTELTKHIVVEKNKIIIKNKKMDMYGYQYLNALALSEHAEEYWDYLSLGYFIRGIEFLIRNKLQHAQDGEDGLLNMNLSSTSDISTDNMGECPFWLFKENTFIEKHDVKTVLSSMRKMYSLAYGIQEPPTLTQIANIILSDQNYERIQDIPKLESSLPEYLDSTHADSLKKYIIRPDSILPWEKKLKSVKNRTLVDYKFINARFISGESKMPAKLGTWAYQHPNSLRLYYLLACSLVQFDGKAVDRGYRIRIGEYEFRSTFGDNSVEVTRKMVSKLHGFLSGTVLSFINSQGSLPYELTIDGDYAKTDGKTLVEVKENSPYLISMIDIKDVIDEEEQVSEPIVEQVAKPVIKQVTKSVKAPVSHPAPPSKEKAMKTGQKLMISFNILFAISALEHASYHQKSVDNGTVVVSHPDFGEIRAETNNKASDMLYDAIKERFPDIDFEGMVYAFRYARKITATMVDDYRAGRPIDIVQPKPAVVPDEAQTTKNGDTIEQKPEPQGPYRHPPLSYRPFTKREDHIIYSVVGEPWEMVIDTLNDFAKNAPDANTYRESADKEIVTEALEIVKKNYLLYDGMDRVLVLASAMNMLNGMLKDNSGFMPYLASETIKDKGLGISLEYCNRKQIKDLAYSPIKDDGIKNLCRIMKTNTELPIRAFLELKPGDPVAYYEIMEKCQFSFHRPNMEKEDYFKYKMAEPIEFDGTSRQWCSVTIYCTIKECCDRKLKIDQKSEIL